MITDKNWVVSLKKIFVNLQDVIDTLVSVIKRKVTYLAPGFDTSISVHKLLQIG